MFKPQQLRQSSGFSSTFYSSLILKNCLMQGTKWSHILEGFYRVLMVGREDCVILALNGSNQGSTHVILSISLFLFSNTASIYESHKGSRRGSESSLSSVFLLKYMSFCLNEVQIKLNGYLVLLKVLLLGR